ncbi:MAG: SAM-dependent methyltransferase, partial [Anaerolineae bacterium]|nr:SAM-dependent methyltransferase [Anaerolineae bacterium]
AFAGIPVTHRNVAQFFTVVTGHTSGANSLGIDWDALPRKGTLVILMGMCNLAKISQQLIGNGRPPETPVAVIQWATVPDQTVVVGTLENIAQQAQGIDSPATIVVGEVVNLSSNLAWFQPDQCGIPAAFTSKIEPLPTKDVTPAKIG